jgi:hypothetical protein
MTNFSYIYTYIHIYIYIYYIYTLVEIKTIPAPLLTITKSDQHTPDDSLARSQNNYQLLTPPASRASIYIYLYLPTAIRQAVPDFVAGEG